MRPWSLLAVILVAVIHDLPAQAPTLLIGHGTADAIIRLEDRNGDGVYSIPDAEAYNYVRTTGTDSSFRTVVHYDGLNHTLNGGLGYFYTLGPDTNQVWRGWDQNANGILDLGTEFVVALDFDSVLGSVGDSDPRELTKDLLSMWFVNDDGDNEGIYRLQEIDGDGDFTFAAGEIVGAAVVPTAPIGGGVASVPLGNVPNTPGATVDFSNLEAISFDVTVSSGSYAIGRLIVEDETTDVLIAFEDLTGDGDFYDAGEVYQFLGLAPTGPLGADASLAFASLAPAYQVDWTEITRVLVDDTGTTRIWYVVSTRGSAPQNVVIFRGVDNNMDGDINDTGELTVYFDGSSDSTLGVTTEYIDIDGVGIIGSDLYVPMEHIDASGVPDYDHLVVLRDLDGSNVIDQPSEMSVLFSMRHGTFYDVLVAPASIPPAAAGTAVYYEYLAPAECMSSYGYPHLLEVGTTGFDDNFVPGQTVILRTWDAASNAPAAIHIGIPMQPGPIPISADGTCVLGVLPILMAPATTDAYGLFDFPIAVNSGLVGGVLQFETLVLDPGFGTFGVTASNHIHVQFGDLVFTQQ